MEVKPDDFDLTINESKKAEEEIKFTVERGVISFEQNNNYDLLFAAKIKNHYYAIFFDVSLKAFFEKNSQKEPIIFFENIIVMKKEDAIFKKCKLQLLFKHEECWHLFFKEPHGQCAHITCAGKNYYIIRCGEDEVTALESENILSIKTPSPK